MSCNLHDDDIQSRDKVSSSVYTLKVGGVIWCDKSQTILSIFLVHYCIQNMLVFFFVFFRNIEMHKNAIVLDKRQHSE